MALPVSLFLETRARCSRSHLSSSTTSDRLRSLRTRRRSCGITPLISRSMREQHIDALDRLDCDWRLVDLCQIEEFAPRMGPAGGLDDRPRLAVGLVEPVEAGIGVRLHQSGIV